MAPRISVVVPMYNAQRYLGAAVESVMAQTLDDWELVLADDGSRDDTLAIAHDYARRDHRVRVLEGVNTGAGGARNRGASATNAQSEFLIFLDSDDYWVPDALSTCVRTLEQHPSAPAAHGLRRVVDAEGRPYTDANAIRWTRFELRNGVVRKLPPTSPTTFESLLVENYIATPGAMLMRRQMWDTVGEFVVETQPCEDWDFNIRMARHAPIVYIDDIVVNWRRHPDAISNVSRRWREAYLRVRTRTVTSKENSPSQRAAAVSAFSWHCRGSWADIGGHLYGRRFRAALRALCRAGLTQVAFWRATRLPRVN